MSTYQSAVSDAIRVANASELPQTVFPHARHDWTHRDNGNPLIRTCLGRQSLAWLLTGVGQRPVTILPRDWFAEPECSECGRTWPREALSAGVCPACLPMPEPIETHCNG